MREERVLPSGSRSVLAVSVPLLDGSECEALCALGGDETGWRPGRLTAAERSADVGSRIDGFVDRSQRSVWMRKIGDSADSAISDLRVPERVFEAVAAVNSRHFGFDVAGLHPFDPVTLMRYEASEGGRYGPHVDVSPDIPTRKLSAVVFLSNPADFTGGGLVLTGPERVELSGPQGDMVVFPSFAHHEVARVEVGRRFSLVGWVHGPPFR